MSEKRTAPPEAVHMVSESIRHAIGQRISAIEILCRHDAERMSAIVSGMVTALALQLAMTAWNDPVYYVQLVEMIHKELIGGRDGAVRALKANGFNPNV